MATQEPQKRARWTDAQVEIAISLVLRLGVSLAAAVVAIGGAVYLARHGHAAPHYGMFRGEPGDLRTVPGIVRDALSLTGRGMIQLGLLLLIATPVARVALSAVAFGLEEDWTYVALTLVVLTLLLLSLTGRTP